MLLLNKWQTKYLQKSGCLFAKYNSAIMQKYANYLVLYLPPLKPPNTASNQLMQVAIMLFYC